MIPNLLSSRAKWSIPYPADPGRIVEDVTGVPIDEKHEFLIEEGEHELSFWATWFLRRGTPFASIQLPDGRWGMWKHKFTHGVFCCQSDS